MGRVDVLVRLIVNGMDTYEWFSPEALSHQAGDMYLEITPITFPVRIRPGISLSQLRFFYGEPRQVETHDNILYRTIFHDSNKRDGSLTVDLQNTNIGGLQTSAFCANSGTPIDVADAIPLWVVDNKPDPCKHWSLKESMDDRLTIETERFYILRSKEKISVSPGIAIYCRASDETIGEMRIHYAGFVHPLFGCRRSDGQSGTPLIFVIQTVQKYGGACDTLNGFPGVLQQAGFLPKGDCEVKIRDRDDCLKHMCKVNARPGHCVAERRPGDHDHDGHEHDRDDFICICKPNHPSR